MRILVLRQKKGQESRKIGGIVAMLTPQSMRLLAGLALCVGLTGGTSALAQQQTLEERYADAVRSCEWGHKSRASSRNYQSGKTRAEVDAKYQSCLATAKKQYDAAVAQRAKQQPRN